MVARGDDLIDVATDRSGTWKLDRPLLADILMPEQKHMDWVVTEVTEKDVPRGWEKIVNQPRHKNSS